MKGRIENADEQERATYEAGLGLLKESFQVVKEEQKKAEKAITAYEQQDWYDFYEYQLMQNQKSDGQFSGFLSAKDVLSQFTIDASIAEKAWLMEKNVTPIFRGEDIITVFYHFDYLKDEQRWLEDQKRIDANGLYSIYYYVKHYVYFLLIACLLFLLGAGFAEERGKRRTIDFLYSLPVFKRNLFLGKAAASSVIILAGITSLYVVTLVISTIFDRFGDWTYPILYYDSKSAVQAAGYNGMKSSGFDIGFHFIPLGEYVLFSLLLLVGVSIFLILLGNVLSIFLQKSIAVYSMTILIACSGYLGAKQFPQIAHLLPFTYFDVPGILNGELGMFADNPWMPSGFGCVVLFISAGLLLLFGWGYLRISERMSDQ